MQTKRDWMYFTGVSSFLKVNSTRAQPHILEIGGNNITDAIKDDTIGLTSSRIIGIFNTYYNRIMTCLDINNSYVDVGAVVLKGKAYNGNLRKVDITFIVVNASQILVRLKHPILSSMESLHFLVYTIVGDKLNKGSLKIMNTITDTGVAPYAISNNSSRPNTSPAKLWIIHDNIGEDTLTSICNLANKTVRTLYRHMRGLSTGKFWKLAYWLLRVILKVISN